uniref:Exportin-5 C-terminal domain-containing protein n=1 Tax=Strigamia maritima TaxID=126957 RepID=T1J6B3_STRMM
MLNHLTQSLWSSFMRHEHISQDSILLSFVARIAQVSRHKLMKVGSPSRNDHQSCQYSIFDFDSDEDFNVFFSKYRTEITDILRLATVMCPLKTFDLAATWLRQRLVEPANSSSFLEWEALALYLDAICSKVFHTDKPKPSAEQGILLLMSVLRHETNDPLILSCALSCISALFIFLTLSSEALPAVLEKLFSAMTFSLPGQTKSNRSRAVKNVRRHACSSLVKICKHHPDLLISSFEQIHRRLEMLSADPNQLSQMEKCTLYEALILITNQFNNYQQQANFFENYLIQVKNIWLSREITHAFSSAETLMHYVGLTRTPVAAGDEDAFGTNRSHIVYCVTAILGVIKRTKCPEDADAAVRGGFLRPYASGCNNVVLCNPSAPFILPFLDNLFQLIRSLNNLWLPEARALLAPEYRRAYDVWDVDKVNVSPMPMDAIDTKQPLERMQHFITSVHDYCYHILGNACPNLMHEFFVMPGLGQHVISHVFYSIDLVPDYRLRSVIRIFMKPFVQFCPSDCYETTLVPVLIQLCPYMFQRLNNKWMQPNGEIKDADENSEVQELLEDQVNRLMSREYIELLGAVLHGKRSATNDSAMDATSEDNLTNLSELGQLALKHGTLCSSIVCCCFHALSWNDSTICIKTLHLCGSLVKHLVAAGTLSGDDAKDLIMCILMGLHVHGQHEGNQGCLLNLAFQAYESLRPLHPEVSNLMHEIPDCPMQVLQSFDKMLLQTEERKTEKRRKEMFKKIVGSIIGKTLGSCSLNPFTLSVCRHGLRHRSLSGRTFSPNRIRMALCAAFSPSTKTFKVGNKRRDI